MEKKAYVALRTYHGLEGRVVPGDALELDDDRARDLMANGLVEPAEAGGKPGPTETKIVTPPEKKENEDVQKISPEDLAKQRQQIEEDEAARVKAEQDQVLGPFSTGGGWYSFAPLEESGEGVKVQGRQAAYDYWAEHVKAGHAPADPS